MRGLFWSDENLLERNIDVFQVVKCIGMCISYSLYQLMKARFVCHQNQKRLDRSSTREGKCK